MAKIKPRKPPVAFPLPVVAGTGTVTSGGLDLSDDAIVTVTGPAATLPSRHWLGGKTGYIESGVLGELALQDEEGWSNSFEDISQWVFDDENVPAGRTLAMLASNAFPTGPANGTGRKTKYYDFGAGTTQEYRTCDYFLDPGVASQFQWKIWRSCYIADEADPSIPNLYFSRWMGAPGAFTAYFNSAEGTGNNHTDFLPERPPASEWFRAEWWLTQSSAVNSASGVLRIRITRKSTGEVVLDETQTGMMLRTTGDALYRYAIWQNYMDNETPTDTLLQNWMHNAGMQWVTSGTGAFVRAELCDDEEGTNPQYCYVESIVGTTWQVRLNGSGVGKWLLLYDATDTPTAVEL